MVPIVMIQIATAVMIPKDTPLDFWWSSLISCSICCLSSSLDGSVCSTGNFAGFGLIFWSNAGALIGKLHFCCGMNIKGQTIPQKYAAPQLKENDDKETERSPTLHEYSITMVCSVNDLLIY